MFKPNMAGISIHDKLWFLGCDPPDTLSDTTHIWKNKATIYVSIEHFGIGRHFPTFLTCFLNDVFYGPNPTESHNSDGYGSIPIDTFLVG